MLSYLLDMVAMPLCPERFSGMMSFFSPTLSWHCGSLPSSFSSEILRLSPNRLIMTEARKLEPEETQTCYNYVRVSSGLLA